MLVFVLVEVTKMTMSAEQARKKEEAKRQAEEATYDVCATGEKRKYTEYSDSPNQINNE